MDELSSEVLAIIFCIPCTTRKFSQNYHLLVKDNAQEGDENRNTSYVPRNLGFTLSSCHMIYHSFTESGCSQHGKAP